METTITVRRPAELLSYIPYRLGYPPHESVVVVSMRPPRRQIGLVVRIDIDDLTDERGGRSLMRTVARHLERDGAEALVVVAYSDREPDALWSALDVVHDEAGAAAPVVDRWLVTASGYANLDCDDPACCPPDGRPLDDIAASEVAARLVYAGRALASSREHAYQLPDGTPEGRRSARRAASRWRSRRATLPVQQWRREGLREWRDALAEAQARPRTAATRLPFARAGRLGAALVDRNVRDAVLVTLVGGPPELADGLVSDPVPGTELDEAVAAALGALVDPVAGRGPDEARVGPARGVLEQVAALVAPDDAAPALTLLALLAWWEGDGGLAGARLDAALDADPSHRLAQIIAPAVAGGLAPGWVRAERDVSGSV
jgi:hypothetical protein